MTIASRHFLLLDFLRIFAVFIIAPYYLNDFSLYKPLEGSSFVFVENLLQGIKHFSFSGFILVFLVFFIMGFKKKNKFLLSVWIKLFFGFLILCLFAGYSFLQWSFHWDTYHFIISSSLIVVIINYFRIPAKTIVIFGIALLCIPFWKFSIFHTHSFWQEALIGVCGQGVSRGTWPLLPWVGLVLFAYGLGALYQVNQKALAQISTKKLSIWIITVIICLSFWGGYSMMPFGAEANCFLHRQSPWVFWVHFMIILFFVRIAFLQKVQDYLAQYRGFVLLEKLSWSTHFGLSFIVFLIINALCGKYFYDLLAKDDLYLLVLSWCSVILTHFVVTSILKAKQNLQV
ncbi:MAG: hypothetical protein HAW63_02725 [Bdellovibrionaceae bacterium]|nr:hypothetical protein [Pseudobdellovibrionaceae bacterium]